MKAAGARPARRGIAAAARPAGPLPSAGAAAGRERGVGGAPSVRAGGCAAKGAVRAAGRSHAPPAAYEQPPGLRQTNLEPAAPTPVPPPTWTSFL